MPDKVRRVEEAADVSDGLREDSKEFAVSNAGVAQLASDGIQMVPVAGGSDQVAEIADHLWADAANSTEANGMSLGVKASLNEKATVAGFDTVVDGIGAEAAGTKEVETDRQPGPDHEEGNVDGGLAGGMFARENGDAQDRDKPPDTAGVADGAHVGDATTSPATHHMEGKGEEINGTCSAADDEDEDVDDEDIGNSSEDELDEKAQVGSTAVPNLNMHSQSVLQPPYTLAHQA